MGHNTLGRSIGWNAADDWRDVVVVVVVVVVAYQSAASTTACNGCSCRLRSLASAILLLLLLLPPPSLPFVFFLVMVNTNVRGDIYNCEMCTPDYILISWIVEQKHNDVVFWCLVVDANLIHSLVAHKNVPGKKAWSWKNDLFLVAMVRSSYCYLCIYIFTIITTSTHYFIVPCARHMTRCCSPIVDEAVVPEME